MYFQNQLKLIATIILCHESNIIIIAKNKFPKLKREHTNRSKTNPRKYPVFGQLEI